MSLSKGIPIREGVQLRLQGEFLNVWNHPVFGDSPSTYSTFGSSVQQASFGLGQVTNNPRHIQIRANIEF